jgi:5'-3' exonuclease
LEKLLAAGRFAAQAATRRAGSLMMNLSISSMSYLNLWRPAASPRPKPRALADDFLAAAVARGERRGGTAIVATGDRDAYQLASEATTILRPIRAGEIARIGPAEVHARYGVDPKQVPDFIALRGDSSDRIPGAAGIGP